MRAIGEKADEGRGCAVRRKSKDSDRSPLKEEGLRRLPRHLKWLGGIALMALLLSRPQAAADGAARAMANWYGTVAPALFPFLALMPLLTCPEAISAYEKLLGGAMTALFDLPGGAAPAMIVGMAAGTPAGTIAARSVAARSGMNRGQLQRMAVAFGGFSPAFLVGGIGSGMLGSPALGWKLLEAQALTQLTLALLLRRAWRGRVQRVTALPGNGGDQPVRAATLTVLTICGYMALFGALNGVARVWVGAGPADLLLCLLDVPSGARWLAAQPLPQAGKLAGLAGMCGFGGVCVALQGLSALKGCGIGLAEYLGLRFLAATITTGYMALLNGVPAARAHIIMERIGRNPYPAALLFASILVIPALLRVKKQSINNVN